MVEQHIGDIAVGFLVSLLTWFTKVLHGDVRKNEADIADLKETLAEKYLQKMEYRADELLRREDSHEIKAKLDKILDKIDTKVDKK